MAFFAFAEGSLTGFKKKQVSINKYQLKYDSKGNGDGRINNTYAARFCAFLRDCAGVKFSFSSLLFLLVWISNSVSIVEMKVVLSMATTLFPAPPLPLLRSDTEEEEC